MDAIWVVVWLGVFAVVTGLAGYLLYASRKARLADVGAPKRHGEHDQHRPHGHHRPGH